MRIIEKILQELENLAYVLRAMFAWLPSRIVYDVPYISQFATPESAEPTLRRTLSPLNDPDWALSGADTPAEYNKWVFTTCGMTCTAMALRYFGKGEKKVVALAKDALKSGVYKERDGEISDMYYREFVSWIKKYGLSARIYTRLSLRGIEYATARGKLVVVSVNPNIRGYETVSPKQKGGHLVLVTGYDKEKKNISFNNPSGFKSTGTQKNHTMKAGDFKKFYAGRGIVLTALC